MKLPYEDAETLLDVGIGGEWAGYTVVDDEYVDTKRWVSVRRLVIRDARSDALYGALYEQGLTEYQEVDRPFGYVKEVEFKRVRFVPVMSIRYEVV